MRRILLIIMMTLSLAFPALALSGVALAADPNACPDPKSSAGQVLNGIGETGNDCDSSGVPSLLSTVVSILSIVVGALAVIMVILAGFKYITSGGEAAKVTNAKNTLIYALAGVAIAALAQLLVHFVLQRADAINSPCTNNSSISSTDPQCK
jgi:hypothetical protein